MQVMQFSLITIDLSVCLKNKTKKIFFFVPSCQSHTLILVLNGGWVEPQTFKIIIQVCCDRMKTEFVFNLN